SYLPGAAFHVTTSCGLALAMKVLPANQWISRTSASVLARNGIVPPEVSRMLCRSAGEIIRGAFPVRAINSADVPGKNGGGNFLGTPARAKIDNNSVSQNS